MEERFVLASKVWNDKDYKVVKIKTLIADADFLLK